VPSYLRRETVFIQRITRRGELPEGNRSPARVPGRAKRTRRAALTASGRTPRCRCRSPSLLCTEVLGNVAADACTEPKLERMTTDQTAHCGVPATLPTRCGSPSRRTVRRVVRTTEVEREQGVLRRPPPPGRGGAQPTSRWPRVAVDGPSSSMARQAPSEEAEGCRAVDSRLAFVVVLGPGAQDFRRARVMWESAAFPSVSDRAVRACRGGRAWDFGVAGLRRRCLGPDGRRRRS
jgi:hypothetical protein